jgi:hypothetical protein
MRIIHRDITHGYTTLIASSWCKNANAKKTSYSIKNEGSKWFSICNDKYQLLQKKNN